MPHAVLDRDGRIEECLYKSAQFELNTNRVTAEVEPQKLAVTLAGPRATDYRQLTRCPQTPSWQAWTLAHLPQIGIYCS